MATKDDNSLSEEEVAAKAQEEATAAKAQEEADRVARGDSTDVKDKNDESAAAGDVSDGEDLGKDGGDEAAAPEAKKPTSTMVPKSRLDTKNRMLSDAQEQIQALEQKLSQAGVDATAGPAAVAKESDSLDSKISAAEEAYVTARKDGDADAELEAMRSIRALEKEQHNLEMENLRTASVTEATESVRFEDVLAVVEAEHPTLNPDNYDPDDANSLYDQDKVDEASELMDALMLKGYTKSQALIRAVSYVDASTPMDTSAAVEADEVAAARTKKAKETAAAAASKAAPDASNAGKNSAAAGATDTLPDGDKLSDEEFNALPDATKKRMRGDTI